MNSTCTAVALVLALVAGHVVVAEPSPPVSDQHSRAAARVDGALNAYLPEKRVDRAPLESRVWKSRAVLAAAAAASTLGPPRTFYVSGMRAPVPDLEPLRAAAAYARPPPAS